MKILSQLDVAQVAGGKLVDYRQAYNVPADMLTPCVMVEVDDNFVVQPVVGIGFFDIVVFDPNPIKML